VDHALNERVQAHLATAREKLSSAERDLQATAYRDCVSRAYYAMYHAARAALLRHRVEPRTHRGVLRMVHQHLVRNGELPRELAQALADVRDLREYGDYGAAAPVTKEDAEAALADARKFLAAAEKLAAEPRA
jgi:hypothetical protein